MKRRDFIKTMGAAALTIAQPDLLRAAIEQSPAAARPNIMFFLVDDMGWQDTSVPFHTAPTPFNRHYRTPNMERLARQGIKFTQAYAASVCSPTRTSIMTGLNAARHHVTNWTLFPDKENSGETARLKAPEWKREGLQPGATTLPLLLKQAGYHTIHVGKAHWGAKGTPGEDPCAHGFDVNIAGHAAGCQGSYLAEEGFGINNGVWAVPGLEKYHGTHTHLTDALTIEAGKELEKAVAAGGPFFLYMAHYAVHVPFAPHDPYYAPYKERGIDETEARYASLIEGMDASLGALLDKLEKLGVAENTLVVFVSDNGGLSAHGRGTTPMGTGKNTHNAPLREGKASAYEGGVRVPLLISWAKPAADNPVQQRLAIKPGAVCNTPIICEDYLPTLCHLAGVSDVSKAIPALDGQDITGLIVGDKAATRRGPLVFHYPHKWGGKDEGWGYQPNSALRSGDWKVIYFYDPRAWELYNLKDDLSEARDLAAEQPAKLAEMAGLLMSELKRLGAQYPIDKSTGKEEPPVLPTQKM